MTGALEATRRALNVVFELDGPGRSFLRRKTIDVLSAIVLMALVLVSLVMVFVGGGFAHDLLGFVGLGSTAADIWNVARWPGAVLVAMLVFALIYYVTPDVKQRAFHWLTPGAAVAVLLWLGRPGVLAVRLADRGRGRVLRRLHRGDPAGGVAVAHQRGAALRRRAERRDRASEAGGRGRAEAARRSTCRPAARSGAPPTPSRPWRRKRRIGSSDSSIPSVTRVGSNTSTSPSRSRSRSGRRAPGGPPRRARARRATRPSGRPRRPSSVARSPAAGRRSRRAPGSPPAGSRGRAPWRPRPESVCSPASGSQR